MGKFSDDVARDQEILDYTKSALVSYPFVTELKIQFDSIDEVISCLHFIVENIREKVKPEFFEADDQSYSSDAIMASHNFKMLLKMQEQLLRVCADYSSETGSMIGLPLIYPTG